MEDIANLFMLTKSRIGQKIDDILNKLKKCAIRNNIKVEDLMGW